MLECYLDDSGTHDNSKVIVWGGVSGDKNAFHLFNSAWEETLNDPCDGLKPPIKAFHSYDLARGINEFKGYNQAERDRTRRNFRKVILDCSLTWISYGISLAGWEIGTKDHQEAKYFNPEGFVFGNIVKAICRSAKEHGDPISFQFDLGRQNADLESNLKPALFAADVEDHFVNFGFSNVGTIMGLQGADLVAHETYQYFTEYLKDENTDPNPHLKRLMDGAFDYSAGWYGEKEIKSAFEKAKQDEFDDH